MEPVVVVALEMMFVLDLDFVVLFMVQDIVCVGLALIVMVVVGLGIGEIVQLRLRLFTPGSVYIWCLDGCFCFGCAILLSLNQKGCEKNAFVGVAWHGIAWCGVVWCGVALC